ncbi:MAG: hypothetical protein Q8941_20115 [Bacteroidota bacterium]|nr:hypothetical protein [Bacteroidota bacterium]
MRKYLFLFLVFATIACNNNSKTADAPAEKDKDAAVEKKAATAGPGGDCSSLILFHKGAIIEGKSYDGTGKEQGGQVTTITDVKNEGSETIANAKLDMQSVINGKENSRTMNVAYKCNGKALYIDLSELMANFSAFKDAKVEANSLEFPLQLSEGQTLPEASVNVQLNRPGMNMKTTSLYTHRKVEGMENVTTPAGTWSCYRISSSVETSVSMGEGAVQQKMAEVMKQKMPPQKIVMWFAPGFGLVKTETYSGDKLSNHSEIISVKN